MTVYAAQIHQTLYTPDNGTTVEMLPSVEKIVSDLAGMGFLRLSVSATAPLDTTMIWLNPSHANAPGPLSYFDGSIWRSPLTQAAIVEHIGVGGLSAETARAIAAESAITSAYQVGDVSNLANANAYTDAQLTAASGALTNALIDEATRAQDAENLLLPSASYTASDVLAKIKTVDGSTSGLDADLLDGLDSTAFVQVSQIVNDLVTGGSAVPASAEVVKTLNTLVLTGVGSNTNVADIPARDALSSVNNGDVVRVDNDGTGAGNWEIFFRAGGAWTHVLSKTEVAASIANALQKDGSVTATGNLPMGGNKITGLGTPTTASTDAATAAYAEAVATAAALLATDATARTTASAALPSASYTAADVLAKIKTVDGSTSGLDADLLDGLNSVAFVKKTDTIDALADVDTTTVIPTTGSYLAWSGTVWAPQTSFTQGSSI